MKEFIRQALYDRYDDFVGSDEILDEFLDDLVELVADGGIREGDSAWTIIDNRYINGEHGTYKDYRALIMGNENKDEFTDEELDEIEDNMRNNGYYYKRDKQIFTSF